MQVAEESLTARIYGPGEQWKVQTDIDELNFEKDMIDEAMRDSALDADALKYNLARLTEIRKRLMILWAELRRLNKLSGDSL